MRRRLTLRALVSIAAIVGTSAGLAAGGQLTVATAATPLLTCTPTGSSGVPITNSGGARADVLDTLADVLPTVHQDGASTATICAARDSYASFQLEVTAPAGLTGVSMSATNLTGPGGATLAGTSTAATIAPTASDSGFPDIQLSREDYTTISTMSDGELQGQAGAGAPDLVRDGSGACKGPPPGTSGDCRFPDVLIPDRDSLVGQQRDAFPFNVPAGESRVVWVDIFVRALAPVGEYKGNITIDSATAAPATVPVDLQVVNATLPATSSIHSAFFMDLTGVPGATPALYQQYADLGLDDRIEVQPDGLPGNMTSVLTSLMTGSGGDSGDYPIRLQDADGTRARLDDLVLSTGADFDDWQPEFPTGPATQPWAYCDEVSSTKCASLYANNGDGTSHSANAWTPTGSLPVAATDSGVPNPPWPDPLTDSPVVPAGMSPTPRALVLLPESLDPVMTPNNNWGNPKSAGSRVPGLSAWRADDDSTRQIWAYTACDEGGCDAPYHDDSTLNGWPTYGIDQDASAQQAMSWLLYDADANSADSPTQDDGLQGEEYWSVNRDDYTHPKICKDPMTDKCPGVCGDDPNQAVCDPGLPAVTYDAGTGAWTSLYDTDGSQGVNGDGTLFYPYDASEVGGTTNPAVPVPLESIRLKRIRDGRQDYELLKVAGQTLAGQVFADSLVKSTFNGTNSLYGATGSSWDYASIRRTTFDAAEQTLFNHFASMTASAPVVSTVSPSSGSKAGGTSVTVTGTGFTGATAVTFGGTAASNVVVNSATSVTVTSPAHAAGVVNVRVTTPAGQSAVVTPADQFAYGAAVAPSVSSVSPSSGSKAGGTSVTVTGTGFTGATAVTFGGTAASNVVVNSATSVTVTSPAHAAGVVNVRVTTPAGQSAVVTPADQFTYSTGAAVPTITRLSPKSGPAAGGTSVTITGTGFTPTATVDFGSGHLASSFTYVSGTELIAASPQHAATKSYVNVTVTTAAGTSAAVTADHFTYD